MITVISGVSPQANAPNGADKHADADERKIEEERLSKIEDKTEREIRRRGLQLRGDCLPKIRDIKMSYREAWRIGKQGCLGVKRSIWDPQLFSGTWYFVCDGTDPSNFLVLYSHGDAKSSERVVISLWEMINAYWVVNKSRILYQPWERGDGKLAPSNKTMVLEGLCKKFYEAMILCVHESQVRLALMGHELKRLKEGFTGVVSAPCKPSNAPRVPRSLFRYSESRVFRATHGGVEGNRPLQG